jgi:large subunit ribosomal protein L25
MDKILIKADTRIQGGKSCAKKVRKEGGIPAVLYGRDTEALAIKISAREWEKTARHLNRNAILEMELRKSGNTESRLVMVKEIQKAFPRDNVLHIDFLQVSMERMIEVEIPIHLIGEAEGVKLGGIAEQHLRTVKAECLPTQIPEMIEVDITHLGIGDSVHAHEIAPQGIKILEGADVAIVTVIPPGAEEKVAGTGEEGTEKKEG